MPKFIDLNKIARKNENDKRLPVGVSRARRLGADGIVIQFHTTHRALLGSPNPPFPRHSRAFSRSSPCWFLRRFRSWRTHHFVSPSRPPFPPRYVSHTNERLRRGSAVPRRRPRFIYFENSCSRRRRRNRERPDNLAGDLSLTH